ncbi:Peptidase C26 [Nesidiocoris tenuis]|uniref:folate gamma-glutamyl hydrolase n=1 Tax=Nesidiocoris tenuis TaxID=355587 RepID=A0ABN7AXT7_9HEMI|nr:Peptidase C26 [Nesidiocoris tenuis]
MFGPQVIPVRALRRPVIGVLMQKSTWKPGYYHLSANYVKALEGAGALVIPVRVGEGIDYYRKTIASINGLVIPGGSANFNDSTDIGEASKILYHLAEGLNDVGVHFPILGVCQGLQLLATISAGMNSVLSSCQGVGNIGLPLTFVGNFSESSLYRGASQTIIDILSSRPVTANFHKFCLNTETVETETALQVWNILSVNNDQNGTEFVSSMEHNAYPFVGVQFHPEKSLFSTSSVFRIENDYSSNIANRWFYDWIVQESWKNNNSFPLGELDKLVMQNYCPQFTVRPNWRWVSEDYFFKQSHNVTIVYRKKDHSEISTVSVLQLD